MKNKTFAVITLCAVALLGMGAGAMDSIKLTSQAFSQVTKTCIAQPQLDVCVKRRASAEGVRYFFNAHEYRNGNSETALGANK
ncbi:hypothetical protein ACI77O_12905 [Pseudomonas tritici]|uniref:hypothetical protein n=1 Tax=Pseudomonas tritici TaxID=2745518 RepID=UPI00387ACC1E